MLKVETIYSSFMGECNKFGIGERCTFIRLSGCNLRCYKRTMGILCDTPEALSMASFKREMSEADILREVKGLNNRVVCLTGGEPLLQKPLGLLMLLAENHFQVVVETNGSVDISPYRETANVSFVIDYKSPSSGEQGKMLLGNLKSAREGDYIKFVLYDHEDYANMKDVLPGVLRANASVGLFWGAKIGYQELLNLIIQDDLKVSLNMQAHKLVCLYDSVADNMGGLKIPRLL